MKRLTGDGRDFVKPTGAAPTVRPDAFPRGGPARRRAANHPPRVAIEEKTMKIHPLITTTDLAAICARLSKADFIWSIPNSCASTYWPAVPDPDRRRQGSAAIDPKAPGIDLTPLLDLLVDNEDVLKIFHAGGQDVEIIYNLTGQDPSPDLRHADRDDGHQPERADRLFQPGRGWLGLTIDKGARFTDWSRRPLTERQIEYAIGDVTHLAKIFPKILSA
jgi:ribonuclease D